MGDFISKLYTHLALELLAEAKKDKLIADAKIKRRGNIITINIIKNVPIKKINITINGKDTPTGNSPTKV